MFLGVLIFAVVEGAPSASPVAEPMYAVALALWTTGLDEQWKRRTAVLCWRHSIA
jgi:hypothetical protein